MAESHFISRLKQLHAEKMGRREQAEVQIKALEEEIEAIDRDLSHILAVARMDDPNANFASVKPIRRRNANGHSASGTRTGLKRRELPELVLSAFRDAAQPLGSADVLAQILLRKPDADPAKLKQQVYAYVSRSVESQVLRQADEANGHRRYVVNR